MLQLTAHFPTKIVLLQFSLLRQNKLRGELQQLRRRQLNFRWNAFTKLHCLCLVRHMIVSMWLSLSLRQEMVSMFEIAILCGLYVRDCNGLSVCALVLSRLQLNESLTAMCSNPCVSFAPSYTQCCSARKGAVCGGGTRTASSLGGDGNGRHVL